jgi:LPS O-antigen subunit length determinant protein (WzzB/FepE family)
MINSGKGCFMEDRSRENKEEIDLQELWQVIVKRRLTIVIISLVIVISVTIINLLVPKIYRGEVILSIVEDNVLNASQVIDILGHIDGQKKAIILPKTYMSVKTLILKPSKNVTTAITVTIEGENIKDIAAAFVELVDYLNNMDSIRANLNEEREILTQKSIEMSNLLDSAAELTAAFEKRLAESRLLDLGFNPIDMRKKMADIKIEKMIVDQALSRLKNGRIQMITPPIISSEPVSPKIARNVILGSILGFLLIVFLVFYFEKIKRA